MFCFFYRVDLRLASVGGMIFMGLKDWLTKNFYVTKPGDPDPFYRPRSIRASKEAVLKAVREVLSELPRWELVEVKELQGRVRATRATRLFRFVDDVDIYVVQGVDGVTRLEMTSRSRLGKGDLGQNKRNLREFLHRFDANTGGWGK